MNHLLKCEYDLWSSLSDESFNHAGYSFTINSEFSKSNMGFMNIAIPEDGIIKDVYSRQELDKLNSIFQNKGSFGNIIVKSGYEKLAIENSEYYILEKKESNNTENLDCLETDDILKFAEIVKLGFDLDESFTKYFSDRMIEMKKRLDSKFFFLIKEGVIVSTCSFFRKESEDLYCAMNGCTLTEYRGNKYFDELILSASSYLDRGVYGRTNNQNMSKSLCNAGFGKVGNYSIVPIRKMLNE